MIAYLFAVDVKSKLSQPADQRVGTLYLLCQILTLSGIKRFPLPRTDPLPLKILRHQSSRDKDYPTALREISSAILSLNLHLILRKTPSLHLRKRHALMSFRFHFSGIRYPALRILYPDPAGFLKSVLPLARIFP